MSDPFSERLNAAYRSLDRTFLDAELVEPRAHVLPGDDEAFQRASDALQRQVLAGMGIPPAQEASTPSGEDTIWNDILNAYRLIETAPSRRTEPIKLTEQQLAAIRARQPERPAWNSGVIADPFAVPIQKVDTVEESTPYTEARQPGGIINIPHRMTNEEFQRFERRWRKKHGGTRNAHRVKLLGRHPWPWWKRAYYRARRWLR